MPSLPAYCSGPQRTLGMWRHDQTIPCATYSWAVADPVVCVFLGDPYAPKKMRGLEGGLWGIKKPDVVWDHSALMPLSQPVPAPSGRVGTAGLGAFCSVTQPRLMEGAPHRLSRAPTDTHRLDRVGCEPQKPLHFTLLYPHHLIFPFVLTSTLRYMWGN